MNPKLHNKVFLTDPILGDIICGCGCGQVIEEKTVENAMPLPEDIRGRKVMTRSYDKSLLHDKGLGQTLSKAIKDYAGNKIDPTLFQGLYHLREWQKRLQANTPSERRLLNAFAMLNKLGEIMQIKEVTKNDAAYVIRKVEEKKIMKSHRLSEFISATIYCASRKTMEKLTIKDLVDKIGLDNRLLMKYVRMIQLHLPAIDIQPFKSSDHITRLCNELGVSEEIKRYAHKVAIKCEDHFVGRNPIGVAAGAIYYTIIVKFGTNYFYNYKKLPLQHKIAESAKISAVTITKACKEIIDLTKFGKVKID